MKRTIVLSLVCISMTALGLNAFASSFKACGEINQDSGDLVFTQNLTGGQTIEGSISGKTPELTSELSVLVGFREVCVEATSDESDFVVSRILSRNE